MQLSFLTLDSALGGGKGTCQRTGIYHHLVSGVQPPTFSLGTSLMFISNQYIWFTNLSQIHIQDLREYINAPTLLSAGSQVTMRYRHANLFVKAPFKSIIVFCRPDWFWLTSTLQNDIKLCIVLSHSHLSSQMIYRAFFFSFYNIVFTFP